MEKIYAILMFFFICLFRYDDIVIPSKDTRIALEELTLVENVAPEAVRLEFAHEDGEYLYVCNEKSVVKFTRDLRKKKVIYSLGGKDQINGSEKCWYIHDFLLIDKNTLTIRLTDYLAPPQFEFIQINLADGTSRPLYEYGDYICGVPVKIGDSIYYSKWYRRDFHGNFSSIIRRNKDGGETEIVKNIRTWNYSNGSIYYQSSYEQIDPDNSFKYSSELGGEMYKCDLNGNNVEKVSEDVKDKAFSYLLEAEKLFPAINDFSYSRRCLLQGYICYQRIVCTEDYDKIERAEIYRQNLNNGIIERVL